MGIPGTARLLFVVMTIFEPLAASAAAAFKRELESELPAPAEAGK